jgi:Domain of unknown function (DUF4760)
MSSIYIIEYLSSFSTVFAAIFIAMGVLLIVQSIRRFEAQQRRVNTADLLGKFYRDLQLPRKALEQVSADEFAIGLQGQSPEKLDFYLTILKYLNEMEFVSLLINSRTVDEHMAKRMMHSALVRAFRSMIEYIMKVRAETGNSALYSELETLAHRWGEPRDI